MLVERRLPLFSRVSYEKQLLYGAPRKTSPTPLVSRRPPQISGDVRPQQSGRTAQLQHHGEFDPVLSVTYSSAGLQWIFFLGSWSSGLVFKFGCPTPHSSASQRFFSFPPLVAGGRAVVWALRHQRDERGINECQLFVARGCLDLCCHRCCGAVLSVSPGVFCPKPKPLHFGCGCGNSWVGMIKWLAWRHGWNEEGALLVRFAERYPNVPDRTMWYLRGSQGISVVISDSTNTALSGTRPLVQAPFCLPRCCILASKNACLPVTHA